MGGCIVCQDKSAKILRFGTHNYQTWYVARMKYDNKKAQRVVDDSVNHLLDCTKDLMWLHEEAEDLFTADDHHEFLVCRSRMIQILMQARPDHQCKFCGGAGCRACGETGWSNHHRDQFVPDELK